jgi:hypothetical protein
MKNTQTERPALPPAYQRWAAQLGRAGWIGQGTVVRRGLRRRIGGRWIVKGPYYLWTSKVAGKTVAHALSREQYGAFKKAIAANRQIQQTIARMHRLTLETILKRVPGVKKRK